MLSVVTVFQTLLDMKDGDWYAGDGSYTGGASDGGENTDGGDTG